MIFAVFVPQTVLINMFGEALTDPLAQIIVRSWGFLIFLMGTLLIYGAIEPVYRHLALIITTISKIVFITLVVLYGDQYIENIMPTIFLDFAFVTVFIIYLIKKTAVTKLAI
jgi:hypothetical protein